MVNKSLTHDIQVLLLTVDYKQGSLMVRKQMTNTVNVSTWCLQRYMFKSQQNIKKPSNSREQRHGGAGDDRVATEGVLLAEVLGDDLVEGHLVAGGGSLHHLTLDGGTEQHRVSLLHILTPLLGGL